VIDDGQFYVSAYQSFFCGEFSHPGNQSSLRQEYSIAYSLYFLKTIASFLSRISKILKIVAIFDE
jgi:hypothetical protein